ncbi:hypothetical protein [Sunxiuqinia indica]|uniref:hypothetical protein n=1 Tax=Sunxiuqinia indica TaxID=2692584 RepID=UPI00135C885A|nr:hypothetical protein [Sunxiuqinia indica]
MKHFYTLLLFLLFTVSAFAQERNWTLNGYIKELFMYYTPEQQIPGLNLDHLTTNTIHNRLNFKWYASNEITVVAEMRNRILFGSLVKKFPDYQSTVDIDNGYFDLSFIPIDGNGWFMHSMFDRAYIDWISGNWQVRAGRQRVNWGINLVWNPNDVFNSFSYFDFDYEERPGTDALRVQYYTGMTSSAELVYKIGPNENEMALAGLYHFSQWSYDFQFIGGWVGADYMIGAGWAGDIRGAGFRGEINHFVPRENSSGSEKATVASISADYTFPSSLYFHTSVLYNSHGKKGNAGGIDPFFNNQLSAKYLSFAQYSLFAQCSYSVTPLLSTSISGIVNPNDGSWYFGPSLTYSLQNNLELMATSQLFFGKDGSEFGDIGQLLFARLKWSF